jgi:hypothetical protein
MIPHLASIITAAIHGKRCLRIQYKGQAPRMIEPHLLFRTESGRFVVHSYQVSGHTSGRRVPPFWRPFQLSKITDVHVTDDLFTPRVDQVYTSVRQSLREEPIATVDETGTNDYFYFNPAVCGPPKPKVESSAA